MARILLLALAAAALMAATTVSAARCSTSNPVPLNSYSGYTVTISPTARTKYITLPSIQPCDGPFQIFIIIQGVLQVLDRTVPSSMPYGIYPTVVGPSTGLGPSSFLVTGPDVYFSNTAVNTSIPPTQEQRDLLASRINLMLGTSLPIATPQEATCLSLSFPPSARDGSISFPARARLDINSVYASLVVKITGACDRVLYICAESNHHAFPGIHCVHLPLALKSATSNIAESPTGKFSWLFTNVFTGSGTYSLTYAYSTPTMSTIRELPIRPIKLYLWLAEGASTEIGITGLDNAAYSKDLAVYAGAPEEEPGQYRRNDGNGSSSAWLGAAVGACLVAGLAIGIVTYRRHRQHHSDFLAATNQRGYSTL